MATLDNLTFEMERRLIVFTTNTTLPDDTQLGYSGDPNNIVNGNTQGESLLYNAPCGTIFIDNSIIPTKVYQKIEGISGDEQITNLSADSTHQTNISLDTLTDVNMVDIVLEDGYILGYNGQLNIQEPRPMPQTDILYGGTF